MMAARFPGADLDGYLSRGRTPQSLVNPHESLRRNFLRYPDPGSSTLLRNRAQGILRQSQPARAAVEDWSHVLLVILFSMPT